MSSLSTTASGGLTSYPFCRVASFNILEWNVITSATIIFVLSISCACPISGAKKSIRKFLLNTLFRKVMKMFENVHNRLAANVHGLAKAGKFIFCRLTYFLLLIKDNQFNWNSSGPAFAKLMLAVWHFYYTSLLC